jgi:hypothetical protein
VYADFFLTFDLGTARTPFHGPGCHPRPQLTPA